MSWEAWIERNILKFRNCDDLLDFLVDKFEINSSSNKQEFVDLRMYIAKWHKENKPKFKKYKSTTLLGKKLGLKDHSGIMHYLHSKTPSNFYEKNTKSLAEAIEKHYICI